MKGTLWTAVEGPALTGLMRDSSSLAANSVAMEMKDSREGVKVFIEETKALRSLKENRENLLSETYYNTCLKVCKRDNINTFPLSPQVKDCSVTWKRLIIIWRRHS